MDEYKGLTIIIPTRNRANLAKNAIKSILNNSLQHKVQIFVSDNSTDILETNNLKTFCRENKIKFVKTPRDFSMSDHWDWAVTKALSAMETNHFLILTDRMVFKNNSINTLCTIIEKFPNLVISYNNDKIIDHIKPIKLIENDWTNKLFRIKSKHLLSLASKSTFHSSFPRMLNSVVSREILQKLKKAYGKRFSSIAPDFYFCFRVLSITKDILYYDKSLIVDYALNRSNGMSQARGIETKDNKDFNKHVKDTYMRLNFDSPIPDLLTVHNAIMNEYFCLKKTKDLPSANMEFYFMEEALDIIRLENKKLKIDQLKVLKKYDKNYLKDTIKARIICFLFNLKRRKTFVNTRSALEYSSSHDGKLCRNNNRLTFLNPVSEEFEENKYNYTG